MQTNIVAVAPPRDLGFLDIGYLTMRIPTNFHGLNFSNLSSVNFFRLQNQLPATSSSPLLLPSYSISQHMELPHIGELVYRHLTVFPPVKYTFVALNYLNT